MPAVVRNILAVIGGVFFGIIVIALIQSINGKLFPVPANFDPKNAAMMKQYTASLPPLAFGVALASYFVGFPLAVFLATRFSGSAHARQGVLVAAFFGAASVVNLRAFEHPAWFWLGNLVALLGGLWFGIRWGLPRMPAPEAGPATIEGEVQE